LICSIYDSRKSTKIRRICGLKSWKINTAIFGFVAYAVRANQRKVRRIYGRGHYEVLKFENVLYKCFTVA
jgi:hypothetical protein